MSYLKSSKSSQWIASILHLCWVFVAAIACVGMMHLAKQHQSEMLQHALFGVSNSVLVVYVVALFWFATMCIGSMMLPAVSATIVGTIGFMLWFYTVATMTYIIWSAMPFVLAIQSVIGWLLFIVAVVMSPPIPPDEQNKRASPPATT